MSNLAHKFENIYEGLDQYSNPVLIQSFMINNNADIVKAVEYFEKKLQNAEGTQKTFYEELVKRYENLMIRRLVLTEDLVSEGTGNINVSKSEEEEEQDRTITKENVEKVVGNKQPAKVIKHPASKQTVNEKLGKKLSKEEEKIVQKTINKNQKEKQLTSHFQYLFPTEDLQIAEFNKYIPKLKKLIEDDKSLSKARTQIKYIFRSGNPKTAFLSNDNQINRILSWIQSDMFNWKSVLDIIKNEKYSISDLVREAEHQFKIEGLSQEKVKDLIKPFFFNNNLKEEGMNVTTDEEFEDIFKRTFSFIWDREHKVENQPKTIDRKAIIDSVYDLYKGDGPTGVSKMASTFHTSLKNLGIDSNPKARIAEITAFLKQKDPTLLGQYLESKNSTNSKVKETPKSDSDKSKEKVSKVEIQQSSIEEGETSSVVNMEEYQNQISTYGKLTSIAEYLITLINKRPGELKSLKTEEDIEAFVYALAKERLLTKGIEHETEEWTIQDVSQFIANNVISYTIDFYKILSATSDNDFKECLKYYIEQFPEGDEKKRVSKLKEVLDSSLPKTQYASNLGKKLRKNNKYVINLIQELTKELYQEVKVDVKTT